MNLIKIKRKTKTEPRYHRKMGRLEVGVTRIQKTFLGIAYKTIHKYRETYHGKIKDCEDYRLERV